MYNTTAQLTDHPWKAVLEVEVAEITVVDHAEVVDNIDVERVTNGEVQK